MTKKTGRPGDRIRLPVVHPKQANTPSLSLPSMRTSKKHKEILVLGLHVLEFVLGLGRPGMGKTNGGGG